MSKPFHVVLIDSAKVIQTGFLPTGLCYLSSFLKKHLGPDVVSVTLVTRPPETPESLLALEPDLVGYSAFTHSFTIAARHAKVWKKIAPQIPLILGGQHLSMAPWSLPRDFDFGVLGEGEQTFLELVQRVIAGTLNLGNAPDGTEHWVNNKIEVALPRQPILPMDSIPFPDRALVADLESALNVPHQSIFGHGKTRAMQVNTSRGCPHRCRFCQPALLWGKYRMHSAEYIAKELDIVIGQYKANAILLEDDLFSISKPRVRTLIDLMRQSGTLGKAEFYVAARTEQIDDEWVQLYKELNVVRVEFGIESGSDKIAAYLKTGKADKETNRKAITLLNAANIGVHASFIAGSPPETLEDLKETWEMMKWIRKNSSLNQAGINIATPLPGTDFWNEAIERKIIDPFGEDWDWARLATLVRLPRTPKDFIHISLHIPPAILFRKVKWFLFLLRLGTPKQFLRALPRRCLALPSKFHNKQTS